MKNIHILPTDKPSRLVIKQNGNLFLSKIDFLDAKHKHNIYITSDEEIKEGDWFYLDDAIIVTKYIDVKPNKEAKKIILTTDQDLIKDGVQAIPDEFLEWFVKNPSCESVKIINDTYTVGEMSKLPLGTRNHKYKIIIPKEEIYFDFTGELDELPNLSDVIKKKLSKEEPKQETLEEAVEKYNLQFLNKEENKFAKEDFINGAKWQQERMYSEEEVKNIVDETIEKFYKHTYADNTKAEMKELWFNKFKKK